jgi:uroporphyrinogen decarboxylase
VPDVTSVPFLDAAAGQPAAHTPVWFMRQAGRSLPEYRALRGSGSILEAIKDVDLSVELTLQPVRRYGVDAAVLYSDIVVPAHAVGFGIDVAPGTGPVCEQPFRSAADLERLRPFDPEADTPYVIDTVRRLAQELPPEVPLLAFAGAPFTVASYLVEGRPSRTYEHTKRMLHTAPDLWHALMERLVQHAVASVDSQLRGGARAFQLFDSWAGTLTRADYDMFVLPYSKAVFDQLRALHPDAPGIHYGVGCDHLLERMYAAGPTVLGLDWRTPISDARRRMGADLVVQGNLDPVLALAGVEPALRGADEVLAENAGHPGHIFNLGHGVHPPTNPDVLTAVVQHVHERTRR